MVQRRRADIRHYLGADTQFPADRQTAEVAYQLGPAHRALFDDVLAYVRGQVQDTTGTQLQQRIRWWSALSLLRALASSPAAAAATLATRAASVEAALQRRRGRARRRRDPRPGRGRLPGRPRTPPPAPSPEDEHPGNQRGRGCCAAPRLPPPRPIDQPPPTPSWPC